MNAISWQQVEAAWGDREKPQQMWQKHWQKEGHPDWETWRAAFRKKYKLAHLPNLDWREEIHETNPRDLIAQAHLHPFKGWCQYYDPEALEEPRSVSFHLLAQSPELAQNGKIQGIIKGIQDGTVQELTIIAIGHPDGRLTIVDGSHSASTLMLIAADAKIRVRLHIGSEKLGGA